MKLEEILKKCFKEDLTESVQVEIETLFEAAVKESVDTKVKEFVEAKELELTEQCKTDLVEFKSGLIDKLSMYLESTVSEWVAETKEESVSDIKVQMSESFIGALKDLFDKNFIEISEENVDVVKDLQSQLEETKDKVDAISNEMLEDKQQIVEYQKALKFKEITSDLSMAQSDKLLKLIEGVDTPSLDTFIEKVEIIKENFINESLDETLEGDPIKEDIENPDGKFEATENPLKKYLPKGNFFINKK